MDVKIEIFNKKIFKKKDQEENSEKYFGYICKVNFLVREKNKLLLSRPSFLLLFALVAILAFQSRSEMVVQNMQIICWFTTTFVLMQMKDIEKNC